MGGPVRDGMFACGPDPGYDSLCIPPYQTKPDGNHIDGK